VIYIDYPGCFFHVALHLQPQIKLVNRRCSEHSSWRCWYPDCEQN